MSTDFNTNISNYKSGKADHTKRYATPISHLESGSTFSRTATNTNETYEVDFSLSAIPGGGRGHFLTTLIPGQVVVFKASADSQANAKLQVDLEGGAMTFPIFSGDAPLEPGAVQEDQMVVVVFNDQGLGRFNVVGLIDSKPVAQLQLLSLDEDSLVVYDDSDDLIELEPGNNDDILTMDQGMPTWVAP
jgi:hypothetical protein